MSCNRGRSVKVVVIETQFVKTDTCHFKSVVQQLTGKERLPAAVRKQMAAIREEAGVAGDGDEGGRIQWRQDPVVLPSMGATNEGCFGGISMEELSLLLDY